MENVNNFHSVLAHEVFVDTAYTAGTFLLLCLMAVAYRFTVNYLFKGRPRIIMPKAVTLTSSSNNTEPASAPVRIQPIEPVVARAIEPVKVQPVVAKPKPSKPTKVVPESSTIDCANCHKQIKSPPIQGSDGKQFRCEHCGTTVALA